MTDDKANADLDDSAFDLDIEDEADTDEIMREAVEAVDAQRHDETDPADGDDPGPHDRDPDDRDPDDAGPDGAGRPDAAELQAELDRAQERAVRALADYENFRRRVERERRDYARYASEKAVQGFLPILDNLGRALEAEGDLADLKQGVEMIHRQMVDLLTKLDVEPVASVGERFDPAVHEAVAREESDEVAHPTILEEFQKGYILHDRLIRPSMVRVAMPQSEAPAAPQSEESEAEQAADDGSETDSE